MQTCTEDLYEPDPVRGIGVRDVETEKIHRLWSQKVHCLGGETTQ